MNCFLVYDQGQYVAGMELEDGPIVCKADTIEKALRRLELALYGYEQIFFMHTDVVLDS